MCACACTPNPHSCGLLQLVLPKSAHLVPACLPACRLQLDFLEHAAVDDVVVCSTVLQEVGAGGWGGGGTPHVHAWCRGLQAFNT